MQADGNLVLTCGSWLVWSSQTHSPGASLTMQTDGNLVVRATDGRVLWQTGTGTAGSTTSLNVWDCGAGVAPLHSGWVWMAPGA